MISSTFPLNTGICRLDLFFILINFDFISSNSFFSSFNCFILDILFLFCTCSAFTTLSKFSLSFVSFLMISVLCAMKILNVNYWEATLFLSITQTIYIISMPVLFRAAQLPTLAFANRNKSKWFLKFIDNLSFDSKLLFKSIISFSNRTCKAIQFWLTN